ncbi:glutathione S-transferase [Aspergillus heteromorphus CBS 117.55]|uniref:Glutathione S-transferase n=1 Tax=Aspergillus heteromorphus CBS 117.55 TaxID=1448321 RepID=A0A317UZK4_9EURO|nr:glutathione S-transferase [Aspergillus heteromorphus CBS 117.55]PWY65987.1 glutathione S-transferase [Aspergillus heteromorphus CBS 117.55]
MAAPKIILYTNRGCPYAQRAHVTLQELGLDFEEVTIDLDVPREPWYLEINPRGLVPSLSYNGTILTESAIVSQFLADAYPSHLLPPSNTPEGALQRARIAFFFDAYNSKVAPLYHVPIRAASDADRKSATEALAAALKKEVAPLIYANAQGTGPFFGGSETLTFAEVLLGGFLLRFETLAKPEYGLFDGSLTASLNENADFARWSKATREHPSVKAIYNEKAVGERSVRRFGKK